MYDDQRGYTPVSPRAEQEPFIRQNPVLTTAPTAVATPSTILGIPAGWLFGGFLGGLLLAVAIALGIAAFGIVMANLDNIENRYECSKTEIDLYSLYERYPDVNTSDWLTQSRDLYSSSYNGHLGDLGSDIKRAVGFCPGSVNSIASTADGVGITGTPTISQDLGMVFFADHGLVGAHTGVTIHAVDLTTCVAVWSATLTALTTQTLATSVNDVDGVDNPLADIYSSLQIVRNDTNGFVVVFGDMGTGAYYNFTMCEVLAAGSCGSRIFVLDATTGELLHRTLIIEAVASVTNYTRQSDAIRMSPMIYRGQAYFGTTSNQTYDVVTTDTINFYSLIGSVNINSGAITMLEPVLNAAGSIIANGNFGAMMDGTPPIDIDADLVIYGSGRLLNQSTTIAQCLQLPGRNRINCMPYGLNSNQLFAHSIYDTVTSGATNAQWRYSPYGVDAWNADCITGTSPNCPTEAGPAYAYGTGSVIIKNECGQRFVVSMGQSGTLYSNDAQTGDKQWTTYIGPSSNETATYGLSFDGNSIYFALGNLEKKSYLTLSGVKRCDSMWVKVNAWTGQIQNIIPVPCSRASADCVADIIPDPFLAGIIDPLFLTFADRGTERAAAAVYCPTTDVTDLRQGAFGATAVGSVITTNKLMLAGSFSGHMHVYGHRGNYITSLAQCDTGIVFGGASIAQLNNGQVVAAWGCGYGTGPYLGSFGDDELRIMRVA